MLVDHNDRKGIAVPFTTTCPMHPEADVSYPSEVWAHIRADHPNDDPQIVFNNLETKFTDMAEALGKQRLFITYCRVCAKPIEATRNAGDRTPVVPYCEDHA